MKKSELKKMIQEELKLLTEKLSYTAYLKDLGYNPAKFKKLDPYSYGWYMKQYKNSADENQFEQNFLDDLIRNIRKIKLEGKLNEDHTENMDKVDSLRPMIEKIVLNPEQGMGYKDIDKLLVTKYNIDLNRPEVSYLYAMVNDILKKKPYNNKKYTPKKEKTGKVDKNGAELFVGDRFKGMKGEGQIISKNALSVHYIRYDKYDKQYEPSYPIGYWDKPLRDWADYIEKI